MWLMWTEHRSLSEVEGNSVRPPRKQSSPLAERSHIAFQAFKKRAASPKELLPLQRFKERDQIISILLGQIQHKLLC